MVNIRFTLSSSALALVVLAGGLLATAGALAAGGAAVSAPAADQDAPWTPERMRAATPMPLPEASGTPGPGAHAPSGRHPGQVFEGFRPDQEPKPAPSGPYRGAAPEAAAAPPPSKGTSGLPFTTTRVYPDDAVTAWPNRMVGKLFFHDQADGHDYVCSAGIVARRVVLTAGHCVYDAAAKKWMTNWAFVPAYNGNLATQPFGTWSVSLAATTSAWMSGGGNVPNPSDFGVVVTKDLFIAGATRKVGEYLGWFGAWTNALIGQQVSALGYPTNLDSGQRMELTTAQVVSASSSTGQIGSAMGGGASGGPWVQDFGVAAAGQTVSSSGPDRVVGVTSYGPKEGNTPRQYLGSSILNSDYVSIRTTACNAAAGNC